MVEKSITSTGKRVYYSLERESRLWFREQYNGLELGTFFEQHYENKEEKLEYVCRLFNFTQEYNCHVRYCIAQKFIYVPLYTKPSISGTRPKLHREHPFIESCL